MRIQGFINYFTSILSGNEKKSQKTSTISLDSIDPDWTPPTRVNRPVTIQREKSSVDKRTAGIFYRVVCVTNTVMEKGLSYLFYPFKKYYADKDIQVIANAGDQFATTQSQLCFEWLKEKLTREGKNFEFCTGFFADANSIKKLTYRDFQEKIDQNIKNMSQLQPYAIHLTIGKQEKHLIERDHTVTILIHNKKIYYFDPKGIPSEERHFLNGLSLREGLEYIQDELNKSSEEFDIVENEKVIQQDCHSCGPLSLYYLNWKLSGDTPPLEDFPDPKTVTRQVINDFRIQMADDITAWEIHSEEGGIPPPSVTRSSTAEEKPTDEDGFSFM